MSHFLIATGVSRSDTVAQNETLPQLYKVIDSTCNHLWYNTSVNRRSEAASFVECGQWRNVWT